MTPNIRIKGRNGAPAMNSVQQLWTSHPPIFSCGPNNIRLHFAVVLRKGWMSCRWITHFTNRLCLKKVRRSNLHLKDSMIQLFTNTYENMHLRFC